MWNGRVRKGEQVAWCRIDGTIERVKIAELYLTDALDRVPAEEAGPGDIIAVAGIPEITIGETLADADDPRPLPPLIVDEPSLAMTVGINTSVLAVRTARSSRRQVENRLQQELIGNVSLRATPPSDPTRKCRVSASCSCGTRRDDASEGSELTVGKPQVVIRDRRQEARTGRVFTIDVPRTIWVSSPVPSRKGRMEQMINTARAGCASISAPRPRPHRVPPSS